MKTIKFYQARSLINQSNVDDLSYVDYVDKAFNEDYSEIIFKHGSNNQLYSFYYCNNHMTIDSVQGLNTFLYNSNYDDFDVDVAPVKKITKQISVTKYIGED